MNPERKPRFYGMQKKTINVSEAWHVRNKINKLDHYPQLMKVYRADGSYTMEVNKSPLKKTIKRTPADSIGS